MLSEIQKAELHRAIDLAGGVGKCSYLAKDGVPGCIIGQLAIIKGVSEEEMLAWESKKIQRVHGEGLLCDELSEFPLVILGVLQYAWDTPIASIAGDDADLRARLHEMVDVFDAAELDGLEQTEED